MRLNSFDIHTLRFGIISHRDISFDCPLVNHAAIRAIRGSTEQNSILSMFILVHKNSFVHMFDTLSQRVCTTSGAYICRMWRSAEMYVFKLFKSLVNSQYGLYPFVRFFKPIGSCFRLLNFFVFSHVRVFLILLVWIRGDSNTFILESQFE